MRTENAGGMGWDADACFVHPTWPGWSVVARYASLPGHYYKGHIVTRRRAEKQRLRPLIGPRQMLAKAEAELIFLHLERVSIDSIGPPIFVFGPKL